MAQPVVSVVIPAYNADKFLPETLDSLRGQTLTEWEAIVVNDGSKDDTLSVAQHYAANDARIRVLDKPNTGVSDTRNQGLQQAQGTYVVFFDADDCMQPTFLAQTVAHLEANPQCAAVYVAYTPFDSETGKQNAPVTFEAGDEVIKLLTFSGNCGHPPSTVAIRKWVLDRIGGFDPKLSTSADWDMWVRIGQVGTFGYLAEPLVAYRLHANQMHRNIALMQRDMLYAFAKARKQGVFGTAAFYRHCMAKLHIVLAGSWYHDARKPMKAIWHTLLAARYKPSLLLRKLTGKAV